MEFYSLRAPKKSISNRRKSLTDFFKRKKEQISGQSVFGAVKLDDIQVRLVQDSFDLRFFDIGCSYWVPEILAACVEYLQRRGRMKTEGLFRLNGSIGVVNLAKISINQHATDIKLDADFLEGMEGVGEIEVAGLIKGFFRELQESFLQTEQTKMLIEVGIRGVDYLKPFLHSLSEFHKATMLYFLAFCVRVSEFQAFNKMSINALAITISPLFLQTSPESLVTFKEDNEACIEELTLIMELIRDNTHY
jgi:hypothetical protein